MIADSEVINILLVIAVIFLFMTHRSDNPPSP